MSVVERLAALLSPWQSIYSDSTVVSAGITSVHLIALLVAGGFAVSADSGTLRALHRPIDERLPHLAELNAVHRTVILGLTALFATGVLQATADIATFAVSPVFWLKLGLIALLLLNGFILRRTGLRLRLETGTDSYATSAGSLWQRLRVCSYVSLALWATITAVGTVLGNT